MSHDAPPAGLRADDQAHAGVGISRPEETSCAASPSLPSRGCYATSPVTAATASHCIAGSVPYVSVQVTPSTLSTSAAAQVHDSPALVTSTTPRLRHGAADEEAQPIDTHAVPEGLPRSASSVATDYFSTGSPFSRLSPASCSPPLRPQPTRLAMNVVASAADAHDAAAAAAAVPVEQPGAVGELPLSIGARQPLALRGRSPLSGWGQRVAELSSTGGAESLQPGCTVATAKRDSGAAASPYSAADEENGEVAGAFRHGEVAAALESPRTSLTTPTTAAPARGGGGGGGGHPARGSATDEPRQSPRRGEQSETFDVTFGTFVNTMSTAASTVNAGFFADAAAAASPLEERLAVQQARQALRETLALSQSESMSSGELGVTYMPPPSAHSLSTDVWMPSSSSDGSPPTLRHVAVRPPVALQLPDARNGVALPLRVNRRRHLSQEAASSEESPRSPASPDSAVGGLKAQLHQPAPSLRNGAASRSGEITAAAHSRDGGGADPPDSTGVPDASLSVSAAAAAAEDDEWGEPTPSAPERHVAFTDPVTATVVEAPSPTWASDASFFAPDYAHMDYKEDAGPSPGIDHHADPVAAAAAAAADEPAGDGAAEDEEDVILRAIPRFRFRRSSAAASSSSPLQAESAAEQTIRAPAWDAWARGGSGAHIGKGDGDAAPVERAPRVFFTKERLASRAALLQSRRVGGEAAPTAAAVTGGGGAAPGAHVSSPLPLPRPPPPPPPAATAAGSAGEAHPLRIRLAPPPAAAALPSSTPNGTIAVALPSFAAPASPGATNAVAVENGGNDDDDGFGGWVQPQQRPSLAAVTASIPRSQPLTRERCVQLLSTIHRNGAAASRPAAAASATAAEAAVGLQLVVDVLRDVFGRSVAPPAPEVPEAPDTPAPLCSAAAARSLDPPGPGESLSTMEDVFEALSFTPLASHDPAASPRGRTGSASTAALAASGASFAFSTGLAGVSRRAAMTAGAPQSNGDDDEDARVRLTRHLLFPTVTHTRDADNVDAGQVASTPPVATFLEGRRLPGAAAAAQWTEGDVLLSVQQEQRRIAQEVNGAVETERLEDVLKMLSAP
ncbi:hypothetical protein NESM_000386300 [Novymonas esmeraldas]|uniref:Uncharacterized protein n=1 Tax=Novymonas esmeraldas TaxID=1808958 RepID=A0AAW0EP98_9TRYP